MDISVFTEKLNKIDGNVYVIEEVVQLTEGVYEAELSHDNINAATLAVYTGPKLTGERIQSFTLSTPSMTPWKKVIRVFAAVPLVYVSYETDGDTVEADDINRVQLHLTETQAVLNDETDRAEAEESKLAEGLSEEAERARAAEKVLSDNLTAEVSRASAKEAELQGNIDAHTASVNGEIQALESADAALEQKKADVSYVNTELGKRYTKEQVYTKEEVLKQIENLIGSAPEVLDTFKEIADALGNDPDFAATMMTALTGKVDKESGKQLTSNDYSDAEKAVVADVNAKKHTHDNKSVLDKLTQTMLDNLANAFAHVSDAAKHITADERNNWADAYGKRHEHGNKGVIDKITQALLDNWNSAHVHLSSKANPHAVTKAQVGLGSVENKTSADIRGELTPEDIVDALGYTPEQSYIHPDSGVKAGTYRSVSVNAQGHVTAGTNPTTLAGYGITDAASGSHNHDGTYLKKGPVTWADLKGV